MSHKSTVTREQKDFTFQIKEFDDATGTVKGYLSTFNNIDEQGDRVRPGSFKRTLQSKYEYKKKHNKTYLMPLLWQHSSENPIGGYVEAKEDSVGLYVEFQVDMDVQRGREAYSGLKKGYIFQQSIGYDVINAEYVKDPDGKMVRDLLELRLWEGSIVTFPANELAVVTSVKNTEVLQTKGASGKTTWPLGSRTAAWDGSEAHNAIVKWATGDDGEIDQAKMKSVHFWYDESAPDKITSYKMLFCDVVSGDIKAMPRGIFACTGGHGLAVADIPSGDVDGVKAKIETYYKRMAKEFDDDTIVAPWLEKDDGKSMNRRMQRKTFEDHYNDEAAQDLLEDWSDIWLCALTCAVFDAFTIGDQPASDISDAIDAFKASVMSKFIPQAQDCDLSGYLSGNAYSYTPGLSSMQNGSSSGYYGYMSSNIQRLMKALKAGRAISAANQAIIDDHVKNVKAMATKAKAAMKAHVQDMHDMVDGMTGGSSGGNADNDGDEDDEKSRGNYSIKAGRAISAAKAQQIHDMADKAMSIMTEHTKAVNDAATDFANRMQGAETPAYGDGEGVADEDQQEGRGKSRGSSYQKRTPATQERPRKQSTALEDVEIPASWMTEIKLRKAV